MSTRECSVKSFEKIFLVAANGFAHNFISEDRDQHTEEIVSREQLTLLISVSMVSSRNGKREVIHTTNELQERR